MGAVRRSAAAGLVAACLLGGGGVALAGKPPPRPLPSAPSEYIEVVPTAGGGASTGRPSSHAHGNVAGSSSARGAAADAIANGDDWRLVALGAVLLVTTLSLVAAARCRRPHAPKG